jgi:rare lipoprotein A (peptidoglycan hydrolase)
MVPASCTACLKTAEPGERPMTRHDQVARTTAPRRRRSTGCYVHVAVASVVTHTNPVGINATGSATWPGSRFHDVPTASYEEVRDRRWHTPRHKSP